MYRDALFEDGTVDSELDPIELASPGDTGFELKPRGDEADEAAIALLPANDAPELDITSEQRVVLAGGEGLRTPLRTPLDRGRRGNTPPPPPLLPLLLLPPTLIFPRDGGDDGIAP